MNTWQRLKHHIYQDYALVAAARYLALEPDDVLLDIGGGGAYYMRRLAHRVRQAVLIDRFTDMYAGGRHLAHEAQANHPFSAVCADAHGLPFSDGSATKVFCNQVLEHLNDPARFLAEVGRVLRPGGLALVLSQNAEFLARYRFPVQRLLCRLLPPRWRERNAYLSGGYEAWERAVGHLHRFTRDDYASVAGRAGLELVQIESVHGAMSMVLWECEAATMHWARGGRVVRVVSRGLLQPVTRAVERVVGRDGLDLVGVFRKPKPRPERIT